MRTPARPRLCRVAGRDTWHIRHGGRRVSTGCTDRTTAEAVLASYLIAAGKPPTPPAIAVILERYLADRRERGIPGADRLGWAHKPLTRILGSKPPEALAEADCRRYAARRRQEGIAEATIRTELAALRAALRWAASPEIALVAAAPKITMPPRPESRVRWLTRDEAARLLDACRAHHVRLFVTIALHTGARSGAILALTWDRVDLVNRLVDLRVSGRPRTRKRRVPVPINDTLHAALTEAQALSTAETVIEYAGAGVARIKHAFRDTAARANLHGVTPHVLRHTAVTWLLQGGVDPWRVAGFTGMTEEMVDQVYGHHHPDYLRGAARALG
ncbi:MAG TPA: site-specific integrase [Acetobacteraceae bacterium]